MISEKYIRIVDDLTEQFGHDMLMEMAEAVRSLTFLDAIVWAGDTSDKDKICQRVILVMSHPGLDLSYDAVAGMYDQYIEKLTNEGLIVDGQPTEVAIALSQRHQRSVFGHILD